MKICFVVAADSQCKRHIERIST